MDSSLKIGDREINKYLLTKRTGLNSNIHILCFKNLISTTKAIYIKIYTNTLVPSKAV